MFFSIALKLHVNAIFITQNKMITNTLNPKAGLKDILSVDFVSIFPFWRIV